MKVVPPRNTCEFVQGTRKIVYSTVLPQEQEFQLSQEVLKIKTVTTGTLEAITSVKLLNPSMKIDEPW